MMKRFLEEPITAFLYKEVPISTKTGSKSRYSVRNSHFLSKLSVRTRSGSLFDHELALGLEWDGALCPKKKMCLQTYTL